jgi:TolB-like protein/Flp pilus assembly protein TadD
MTGRNAELPAERRITFRIGINLGDIIVDGDDIYGNGVNVAARLEALAEPGGICLSGRVLDQVEKNVDVGFASLGPQTVKNIEKPVNAYKVLLDPADAGKIVDAPKAKAPPRWRWVSVVALLALIVGVGGAVAWFRFSQPEVEPASVAEMAFPLPEKPSIAVLPFDNLSGDPDQAYFADGMTEDLITDLSKVSGLFVIARNSTFAYKGKPVDIRQVAEQLGVRYVLEGSIQRAGNQIRINAQLIDALTGGHVWADRYDGSLTNVFALQDAVAKRIVAALAVNLTDEEKVQPAHKYTHNADAYDAFLQGWDYYQRFSADDFVQAIPFFERAVQLDPNFGRTYAALASLYWESVRQGESWTSKVCPDAANFVSFTICRVKAEKYLELAMMNPSPLAHRLASAMSLDYRQFDDAIAEAGQAVALDPNDPDGYAALAWALTFGGRPQEALAAVERAMRLDPQNPGPYLYVLGMALLGLDQYEDALLALQRAHQRSPQYLDVNVPLAVTYAHLGRDEEARVALSTYTDAWTSWVSYIDHLMGWWPFKRETDIRRFGGGLLKAGLCCEERLEEYIERVR